MEFAAKVDARQYEPMYKHSTIMSTFESLKPGEVMELTNDHDPVPLKYQFMYEKADQFSWEYLENGPQIWRVAITKIAVAI